MKTKAPDICNHAQAFLASPSAQTAHELLRTAIVRPVKLSVVGSADPNGTIVITCDSDYLALIGQSLTQDNEAGFYRGMLGDLSDQDLLERVDLLRLAIGEMREGCLFTRDRKLTVTSASVAHSTGVIETPRPEDLSNEQLLAQIKERGDEMRWLLGFAQDRLQTTGNYFIRQALGKLNECLNMSSSALTTAPQQQPAAPEETMRG